MEENLKYAFDVKDIKDRLFNGIPLIAYIILFVVSFLLQLVEFDFKLHLILSGNFLIRLAFKYLTTILVLVFMYPFFKNKLNQSEEAAETKKRAQEIKEIVVKRRLSRDLIDYTKIEMEKEEKEFILELLSDCGNIDPQYLEKNFFEIKKDYKNGILNKPQFRLIRLIKKGRIKFYKLKGDEIKYVAIENVTKNKKYKDQSNNIIKNEFAIKIVSMAVIAIIFEVLANSFADGGVFLKDNWFKSIQSLFLTAVNYATATYFAFSLSHKVVEEWKRFTHIAIEFTSNFIEAVENNTYVPASLRKNETLNVSNEEKQEVNCISD